MIKDYTYKIHEIAPYINWLYFFHAWDFQPKYAAISQIHGCDCCRASWLTTFNDEELPKAEAAMQLFKEANKLLNELDADFRCYGRTGLYQANSHNDDIIVYRNDDHDAGDQTITLHFLRQQHSSQKDGALLCLSDFIRPDSFEERDTLGIFATTVDHEMEHLYESGDFKDDYKHMLAQTLADRLAEATAEKMHEDVRRNFWGYSPDENLTISDLHSEKYQGIRPAVGYPSMPDQTFNFSIDELIRMHEIGIHLTENGAMIPHASVSGLMFAHPKARYFSIGKIGKDQFTDYANRKGIKAELLHKFLSVNLD